jgi:small subunit ribosomal protein S16
MAVKIRLARHGAKKYPYYHIVVANSRSPRVGSFIVRIGSYNPNLKDEDPTRILIDNDKAAHWLSVGAQPTDRVKRFFKKLNISAKQA